MADWLDTAFAVYDYGILGALHLAAERAGAFLTPLMKLVTLLGEKGLLMFLTALVLLCFARTRKLGLCVFGAVCCGALITNIVLKDLVARPRPFESYALYKQWWMQVGAPAEDGFSFPSGHVTAAAAGVTGLCLMRGKRFFLPGAIWVLLMMFSRNYLMAHYPSDVLFALLIGVFSGFVAALITQLIFRFLENHAGEGKFYDFLLYSGIEGKPDLKAVAGTVKSGVSSVSDRRSASGREEGSSRHAAARHQAKGTSPKSSRHSGASSGTYQGKH